MMFSQMGMIIHFWIHDLTPKNVGWPVGTKMDFSAFFGLLDLQGPHEIAHVLQRLNGNYIKDILRFLIDN